MSRYRFPRMEVTFSRRLTEEQRYALEAIPGNRINRRGVLTIPINALAVVGPLLDSLGVEMADAVMKDAKPPAIPWEDHQKRLLAQGEVQEWVFDNFLVPFQEDAIAKTGTWNGAHFWHPTGAGKTLSGILWCLLEGTLEGDDFYEERAPIIVITRAASRIQYGREFLKYTYLKPHVIRPVGQRKKNSQTPEEYLEWCKEENQRPILVVAWESMLHHMPLLMCVAQQRANLVFDESHRGKSMKRWQAIPLPIPNTDDPKKLATIIRQQEQDAKARGGFIPNPDDQNGQRHYEGPNQGRVMIVPAQNVTSCASKLAKAASRVLATTATPVKDRVRDLWGQLDLVEPYGHGSKTIWTKRYCDAKPGRYGGMDTTGHSNLDELAARLEHCVHRVDYQETHKHLPPKRRQSVYIAPEDQCRPSAGFPKELRAASKRGAGAVLEVRLASAASRKRKAVVELIEEHVGSKHKICVFTGRRRDVAALEKSVRAIPMVKKNKVDIWATHGGDNATIRQGYVDDYMAHPGPCIIISTHASLGESMDIQDTDAALFVMLPYTPGEIRQAEGRFCRFGQKRPVVIYYIIAEDTADEHIADILIGKLPAVQRLVHDDELAEAEAVIAGLDDEEAILDSIFAKMEEDEPSKKTTNGK